MNFQKAVVEASVAGALMLFVPAPAMLPPPPVAYAGNKFAACRKTVVSC